jgi:hypothetical protein
MLWIAGRPSMDELERIQKGVYDVLELALGQDFTIREAYQDTVPVAPCVLFGAPSITADGYSSLKPLTATTAHRRHTATVRVQLWELGSYGSNLRKIVSAFDTEEAMEILDGYGMAHLTSEDITPVPRAEDRHYVPESTLFINLTISTLELVAIGEIKKVTITRNP